MLKVKLLSHGVSDFPLVMAGGKTQGRLPWFPACIVGMGLSSARRTTGITVALLLNNVEVEE